MTLKINSRKYDAYTEADSLKKNGFVIVPGVLSKGEISSNRDLIDGMIREMADQERMLFISDILKNKDLLKLLVKSQCSEKILFLLNQIFDHEFFYINDLQIQCSMFGISSGGWHIDANSEVNLQSGGYLHDANYSFAKVGIYLQDNTVDFGGGIDVIPKSHKVFKYFMGVKLLQYGYARIASKLIRCTERFTRLTVPLKAGDAVIFDSRTLHRSSVPHAIKSMMSKSEQVAGRVSSKKLSSAYAKFSLYWEVGRQQDALDFLKNSCKRAMVEELLTTDNDREKFYMDYLQYSYPADYPSQYEDEIKNVPKLNILSLDESKARLFKAAFK